MGDQEPIIVNISHESKSVGNSEAAIWQWMCLANSKIIFL